MAWRASRAPEMGVMYSKCLSIYFFCKLLHQQ